MAIPGICSVSERIFENRAPGLNYSKIANISPLALRKLHPTGLPVAIFELVGPPDEIIKIGPPVVVMAMIWCCYQIFVSEIRDKSDCQNFEKYRKPAMAEAHPTKNLAG